MRPRHFFLLTTLLAATPAAAQLPISGVGEAGGAEMAQIRRLLVRHDDRPDRVHNRHRSAELAGQIGQLHRRIADLRETGQITRAEARAMRRQAGSVAVFYSAYEGDGISDSEAAELQNRILVAHSLVRPTRPPRRRR